MSATTSMRVLVTGSALRIGRAIACAFAEGGHRVIIHYRSSHDAAEELCRHLGGEEAGHSVIGADFARPEDLAQLFPRLAAMDRLPDCLINNAGTFPRQKLIEHDLAFIEETFRINCHAPFLLMRDFARLRGEGVIVNLLDQRIETVNPASGAYAIAKKALRDFTLACALDWAPRIRVNAVAPGLSLAPPEMASTTRAQQIVQVPMRQQSSPEEIAAACRFLAESPTITGAILPVDGGLHLSRLA